MGKRDHIVLGLIAVSAWTFFYILGIPSDYFQSWNPAEQILLSLITFFAGAPFIAFITIVLLNRDYLKTGIWLAFYTSFFLALLDFIICGIVQGGGISIFATHWYLTIGYIYVWIIGPLMGFTLNRLKTQFGK